MSIFKAVINAVTGGASAASGVTTLEIRQAILRTVKAKALEYQGAGDFPFSVVRVTARAPEAETRQRVHHALYTEAPPLAEAVRLTLKDAGFSVRPSLRVDAEIVEAWPEGIPAAPEALFAVTFAGGVQAAPTRGASASAGSGTAVDLVLRVIRGKAEQETYPLTGSVIKIGRGARHRLADGAVRQNTIAFLQPGEGSGLTDEEARINERVGRAHASIVFDSGVGLYRLLSDGSATLMHCRGEQRLSVASKHQRVHLQPGDCIEFGGDATLQVEAA